MKSSRVWSQWHAFELTQNKYLLFSSYIVFVHLNIINWINWYDLTWRRPMDCTKPRPFLQKILLESFWIMWLSESFTKLESRLTQSQSDSIQANSHFEIGCWQGSVFKHRCCGFLVKWWLVIGQENKYSTFSPYIVIIFMCDNYNELVLKGIGEFVLFLEARKVL